MCGRYVTTSSTADLMQLLLVDHANTPLPPQSFNVAPTTNIVVAVDQPNAETGEVSRVLTSARWGLVPHWAKGVGSKPLINARSETVLEKPSFRRAVRTCRVLVPCDGWFEWRSTPGSTAKEAWFLHSGAPLFMAGIGSWWRPPSGKSVDVGGAPVDTNPVELFSVAILTEPATGFVEQIHHRSPMFVPAAAAGSWMCPQELDSEDISDLLASWPVPEITGHRVSADVGKVSNNHPGLIEAVGTTDSLF